MAKYFKTGATVWNSANSWSTGSAAGTDNAGTPTVSDDVIFTSTSGATCAVTTTAGLCLTLNTTGYTGTITLNTTVTVSGNITLGASTVMTGSSALICNASATLTSNGNTTINCPFTLSNVSISNTYTLADNWTLNGLFSTTSNAGALTHTINGNNIFCKSGFTINTGSTSAATLTTGTTIINMTGTGTILFGATAGGGLGNPFIINTLGTITMTGIQIYYRTGTFTYVKGTINGAWTLTVNGSCTLDMNNGGLSYNVGAAFNVPGSAATITMLSDFYCTTVLATSVATINGFSIYSTGAISISGTLTGTTVLRLKSSASGQTLSSSGNINCDISFEAGANTITIGSAIFTPRVGGQSVTYTSGAVTHTGTLTVNGPNTITFNTSGMSWNNIIVQGSSYTITINSLLTVLGTLSFQNQNYTFAGTSGFTAATLSYTSTPVSTNTGIVLAPGITYTVTTVLNLYSATMGTYLGIKSSAPGSVAYLKLNFGATQLVGNTQVTDIDSSGSQSIFTWQPGTISNTTNWKTLTFPKTLISTF